MSNVFRPKVVELPASRRPRVSVVIPCFNYGHWLESCVESALQQEGVSVDVIVIDDASKDDSVQVGRRLVSRDKRVRLIENGVNRGHIRSVNAGLDAVTGEYIVKLDADDLLAPGSLARSTALL